MTNSEKKELQSKLFYGNAKKSNSAISKRSNMLYVTPVERQILREKREVLKVMLQNSQNREEKASLTLEKSVVTASKLKSVLPEVSLKQQNDVSSEILSKLHCDVSSEISPNLHSVVSSKELQNSQKKDENTSLALEKNIVAVSKLKKAVSLEVELKRLKPQKDVSSKLHCDVSSEIPTKSHYVASSKEQQSEKYFPIFYSNSSPNKSPKAKVSHVNESTTAAVVSPQALHVNLPGTPKTRRCLPVRESPNRQQAVIDAGQKNIGAKQCGLCGMVYTTNLPHLFG